MTPLTPHPSWTVLDSSKTQEFMDCPRKFFYRYVLGWTSDEPNVHLVFGDAIHHALEYILLNSTTPETVGPAYNIFTNIYRKVFPDPETDELREPKSPAYAFGVLSEYVAKYHDYDKHLKVHFTEVAGSVPLDLVNGDKILYFRLDAIVEDNYGIWIMDHKTHGAHRGDRAKAVWIDQWSLSFQMGLYTHVAYCLFNPKAVQGTLINDIELKRPTKAQLTEGRLTGGELDRHPIKKTPDMMNVWLYDAHYWYDSIHEQLENLESCQDSDLVMQAFPRNTQSCTKYFGCPYRSFCSSWSNPLRKDPESPPPGMKVEWWDPRDHQSEATKVMVIK